MKYPMFKYKSPDFEGLKKYGFKDANGRLEFQTSILDGEFNLFVFVEQDGNVLTKLVDNNLQEEYVLHLNENATGSFVGKVREEFDKVLNDIALHCFFGDVFKSKQAKEVIEYIANKYGDKLEFLWEKLPDAAIWRRKDNRKWYGVIMSINKGKLDKVSDEMTDIIDIRVQPEKLEGLIDGDAFFKAYHMNKVHWMTICLNSHQKNEVVFKLIDESYALAKK